VHRTIQRVIDDPAIPISWPSERPGMSGGDPLPPEDAERALELWLHARDEAVKVAKALVNSDKVERNLHKSLVNRLLEPFMWHTVIITATEWENFWGLRSHEAAMPEIHELSDQIWNAMFRSVPRPVSVGNWHLPYVTLEERNEYESHSQVLCNISSARCARVSVNQQDGTRSIQKDIEFTDSRLMNQVPPHASPLEHVATPCEEYLHCLRDLNHMGNFDGWHQYRHLYSPPID
jgi:hypothetical protein